jgi:Glycosyl transferase family 2
VTYEELIEEINRLSNEGISSARLLTWEFVEKNPSDVRAYLQAGEVAERAGHIDEAVEWFDKAERVAPWNFWPYFLRARIFQKNNKLDRALKQLQTAASKCIGRVSSSEYDNIIGVLSDVRALLAQPDPKSLSDSLSRPAKPGRPLSNCVRLALVKDEEDVIYPNLQSSYLNGFRCFAVADNGSTDDTRKEIDRFTRDHKECLVYVVTDPVVGHYQADKTMGLARLMRTVLQGIGVQADWFFPLDADEFLCLTSPAQDLKGLLRANSEKNLLTYYLCNCAAKEVYSQLPKATDFASLFPVIATYHLHPVRKVAFRYKPDAFLTEGNHFCRNIVSREEELLVGAECGVFLKHYPIRSVDHIRKKVVNGGKALAAYKGPPDVGAHWRHSYTEYLEKGEPYLVKQVAEHNAVTKSQARM